MVIKYNSRVKDVKLENERSKVIIFDQCLSIYFFTPAIAQWKVNNPTAKCSGT